jgi:hypothetical protein
MESRGIPKIQFLEKLYASYYARISRVSLAIKSPDTENFPPKKLAYSLHKLSLTGLAYVQLELTLKCGDSSMPFGQSTPLSVPLGITAGIAGGHYAGKAAEALGLGEQGQKVATGLGHWAASSATGYAINALGGADVTGGVAA